MTSETTARSDSLAWQETAHKALSMARDEAGIDSQTITGVCEEMVNGLATTAYFIVSPYASGVVIIVPETLVLNKP